jgi:G:T-mismatch repair DNA endonuclease (very short patch repair protein)
MGWDYMIVWECEAREAKRKGTDALAARVKKFLG